MTHHACFDALASYALGALPPEEAKAAAQHLATCAACEAEYRMLAASVTAVAYSAQACATGENGPQVPAALRERVLQAARRSL